jgi:membrane-bound serine protease (ClpP class)
MRRALGWALAALLPWLAALPAAAESVARIRIDGGINPAIGDFVKTSIARAHADGANALVIELDTPGGLVSTTKDIVTEILNAPLPNVVYVAPRGAWAASAGTFITLAGHVAAMAPGSTIGAAHPVSIGGEPAPPAQGEKKGGGVLDQKVENMTAAFIEAIAAERKRNVKWAVEAVRHSVAIGAKEALDKKVIDLIADDLPDLLAKLDGRKLSLAGKEVVLHTAGVQVVTLEMDFLNRIFAVIADPEIVGLLFMLGILGLYVELQNPGMIVPGALGATCLLLAAFALQVIPFNWIGLVLVIGGIALLIAEVHLGSFGALFALGIAALAWGAWLMFRVPELSDLALPFWRAIFPAVAGLGAAFALLAWSVSRAQARPQFAGAEALVGELGVVDKELAPEGLVLVKSELWKAVADAPLARGERVRIESVRDLVLRVRRAEDGTKEGRS